MSEIRRVGRVYKLVSLIDDQMYVGSTFDELKKCMWNHINNHTTDDMKHIYGTLESVGWSNVRIVMIKKYPNITKEILKRRERYYVRKLKPSINVYNWRKYDFGQGLTSSKCAHGRVESMCKPCGGINICMHGRVGKRCNTCISSSPCPHGGFMKIRCEICMSGGDDSICIHGVRKRTCRSCDGVDTVRIKCGCGSTVVRGQLNRHDKTKKHQRYLAKHKRWVCAAASMAAVVAPAIVPKMAEIAV